MQTIESTDKAIEARIMQLKSGAYSVTLRDTEADQILPTARIFKDYQSAADYAVRCVTC